MIKKVSIPLVVIYALFFVFLSPNNGFAVNHFFNGKNTTLKDINTPLDTYFGGSDSATGRRLLQNTSLVITTQNQATSFFQSAYGGGKSSRALENIIQGQSVLIVVHSGASQIVGGSLSQSHTSVGGVELSVLNSRPLTGSGLNIYGGCVSAFPGSTQHIDGSIFMNITGTSATKVSGLGTALDPLPQLAVRGDVFLNLNTCVVQDVFLAGELRGVSLGGKANLVVNNSIITNLWGTQDSNILGTLSISLNKSQINTFNLTRKGSILGAININVNDTFVNKFNLGPVGQIDITAPVTLNITGNSNPGEFFSGSVIIDLICGPTGTGTFLNSADINLFDGHIQNLYLGSNVGLTGRVHFTMYGNIVKNLHFGDTLDTGNRHVRNVSVDICGGLVENFITGRSDSSSLNFIAGGTSRLLRTRNAVNPREFPFVENLSFKAGSDTVWGVAGEIITLKANTLKFDKDAHIAIAEGARLILEVGEKVIVNGSKIAPQGLRKLDPPPLSFVGGGHVFAEVPEGFEVDFSFSPDLYGENRIPLTTVSPAMSKCNLFQKDNCIGLFWSDCLFDQISNTWYCTNIRYTQDFYGISAARKASSWLRMQQALNVQSRAHSIFDGEQSGLWVNTQGGHEKFYTIVGKSKMSWVMASMGYDFLQPLVNEKLKALYGFCFSIGEGYNRWHTIHRAKNTIYTGMLDGYCGLMHSSGIYGSAVVQVATSKAFTKNVGLSSSTHKWTEVIPTQSIELGWKYTFNNSFRINPRGQVTFEELPKRHINMPSCGNDTEILGRSFLTTTSLGIVGEYDILLFAPTSLQSSIEWIKGTSGDFGVKSKILKKEFKDKNSASTFRTSLGMASHVGEHTNIQCNVFVDLGDNEGVGGQLSFTYKF